MVNVPELKRGVLNSVIDAIGNTPIVKLNNICRSRRKNGIFQSNWKCKRPCCSCND